MSQIDILMACGLFSGLLSACAYAPYIWATLKGQTRPQRSSWFIWTVLSTIALIAQIAEGASQSLLFATVQASATLTIFLLGLRRGEGGLADKRDLMVLAAAALGLVLWTYTDTPAYALLISISISFLGGISTILKAYRRPATETMTTWALCWVASCLAMIAVGQMDWLLLAYPIYLFCLNGAIVTAQWLGRRAHIAPAPIAA